MRVDKLRFVVFTVFRDQLLSSCIKNASPGLGRLGLEKIKEKTTKAVLRHLLPTFIQNKGQSFISTGAGDPPFWKIHTPRRRERIEISQLAVSERCLFLSPITTLPILLQPVQKCTNLNARTGSSCVQPFRNRGHLNARTGSFSSQL